MKIYEIHHHLYMPLRLHKTAHDTKRADGFAISGQESRDNGMIGLLMRSDTIGSFRVHIKIESSILKCNARFRHYNPGTEIAVIRLNKTDHIACAVRCTQINRTAAGRIPVLRFGCTLTNIGRTVSGIDFRQHLLRRHFHASGICNILLPVRIGQFHGLQLPVNHFFTVMAGRKLHTFHDIQSHQCNNAVTVRRYFPHIITSVGSAHWLYPFGLIGCQISFSQITAGCP